MKNRTEIEEIEVTSEEAAEETTKTNYYKNELFWLDPSISDELLLNAYVESQVKDVALKHYLFYESNNDENINTLNLGTNLKRYKSDGTENYDYWQACLLAFEYIESAIKTLNYVNGKDKKEVKKYSHDIEELVNLLPSNIQKELSMNSLWLDNKYLLSNFGPAKIECEEKLGFRERLIQNGLEMGHNYFKKYMRRICNGVIDIRYSDISTIKNDCDLDVLLKMSGTLSNLLEKKYEPVRHEFYTDAQKKYDQMIDTYPKDFILPTEDKPTVLVPNIKFTAKQLSNTKQSVDAKYKALKFFVVACNNYNYCAPENSSTNKIDANSTMDEIILKSHLFRNEILKKSGDGDVWKNYCYYESCHLASLYIEHALKYMLLSKGKTYDELMNNYGHDFKKMYEDLDQTDKDRIKDNCLLLGDEYMSKAVSQRHTNDRIKNGFGQKATESSFDTMLDLMNDAFLETRYPHSENYNIQWRYSLRFMLKFADETNNIVQEKDNIQKKTTGKSK